MLWLILVVVLVVLAVGAGWFYRHAQDVEADLDAMPGGAPPPMFGTVQGKIRRKSTEAAKDARTTSPQG